MKTRNKLLPIALLLALITSLSSCELIADIFKGGVYVGIILVIVVIAIVIWLLRKIGSR
jgi:hypothetical protein